MAQSRSDWFFFGKKLVMIGFTACRTRVHMEGEPIEAVQADSSIGRVLGNGGFRDGCSPRAERSSFREVG